MARYRHSLPQLSGDIFLTDGGIETTLVFHDGFDLPYFAAFDLMKTAEGRAALDRYFRSYMAVAEELGLGLILESATWRASRDWAEKLGYSSQALADVNRASVAMLADLREKHWPEDAPMLVSGCVGPRGDGYDPGQLMTAAEAEAYHGQQVRTFAGTQADMVTAITMTNIPEATGLTRACQTAGLPGGDLLHGRDRRQAAHRRQPEEGHRERRSGHRQRAALLHDQLCAPHPLRPRAGQRRGLAQAALRPEGQCILQEPSGAGRVRSAGRGRSARFGRALRRAASQACPT